MSAQQYFVRKRPGIPYGSGLLFRLVKIIDGVAYGEGKHVCVWEPLSNCVEIEMNNACLSG